MTTAELEAKKAELIKEIDTEELLDKMLSYLHKLKRKTMKSPCQYTIEELREHVDQALKEAELGLGCTQKEMKKKYLEWK